MTVGYIRLTLPDGSRVLEHRHVYEQFHKINLTRTQIIHHINGVKTDNRPENLKLVEDHNAHNAEHGGSLRWKEGRPLCPRGHVKDGICLMAGKPTAYCLACNRERARQRKENKQKALKLLIP